MGHSADVKRSICLNGAKMQCGIFLGDSVLGCGARIGSGVITANRKFNQGEVYVKDADGAPRKSGQEFFGAIIGRYCRLGANVVTYPGTIIREHTWVGAGCILHGSYGPDEFVSVKQQLDIRPKKRLKLRSGKGEYEHSKSRAWRTDNNDHSGPTSRRGLCAAQSHHCRSPLTYGVKVSGILVAAAVSEQCCTSPSTSCWYSRLNPVSASPWARVG